MKEVKDQKYEINELNTQKDKAWGVLQDVKVELASLKMNTAINELRRNDRDSEVDKNIALHDLEIIKIR